MSVEIVSVPSVTSGHPLVAIVIKRSKLRKFFNFPYVLLNIYNQGLLSPEWGWSKAWFRPEDINWLEDED